jgi:two-component sensor histidine kinase
MTVRERTADEHKHKLLTGQVAILTMIARDAPAVETIEAIIGLAERLEPGVLAGVMVLDRAEYLLEMAVFPSMPRTFIESLVGIRLGFPHASTCVHGRGQGCVPCSEDRSGAPQFAAEWLQLCADHGIRSCHSQSVRSIEGTPLGTFTLCFRQPRERDDFDCDLIATCVKLMELTLERRRILQRQELVVGELQHRVKNVFASVAALAHFSFEGNLDISTFRRAFQGRLNALTDAHALLLAEAGADLALLLMKVLEPYAVDRRIEIDGPPIRLAANAASSLSMAAHELATNAAKYGALSNLDGRISVVWNVAAQPDGETMFTLHWIESGGPRVEPPNRRGFGVRAIERLLAHDIAGQVHLNFVPEGLRCAIRAPFNERLGRSLP